MGLFQIIMGPTHDSGYTLDMILLEQRHWSDGKFNIIPTESKGAEALDRLIPVWPLLTHHSWQSLWFMEELWVLKRVKRFLECHWIKMDESDWTWLWAATKAYLLVVRLAKQHYFSTLIASAECHTVALLWLIQSLLRQETWVIIFNLSCREICSTLDRQNHSNSYPVGTHAWCRSGCMSGEGLCSLIWEQFNPVGSEKVDKVLDSITATICQPGPCPS